MGYFGLAQLPDLPVKDDDVGKAENDGNEVGHMINKKIPDIIRLRCFEAQLQHERKKPELCNVAGNQDTCKINQSLNLIFHSCFLNGTSWRQWPAL